MLNIFITTLFATVVIDSAIGAERLSAAEALVKEFGELAVKQVQEQIGTSFISKTNELEEGKPDQGTLNPLQQRRFKSSGSTTKFRDRQVLGSSVIATTADFLRENRLQDPRKLPNKRILDLEISNFINIKLPPVNEEAPFCPPYSSCPASKYRTIDGFCNNLQSPNQGRAGRKFGRWLNPIYSDAQNCNDARTGLPNAREVSKAVHETTSIESNSITHMVMQWGQFIDHDITHTPLIVANNIGTPLSCQCGTGDNNCHNIDLFSGDQLISANGPCISFARSKPAAYCECGCREQENSITSYIDASNVYGSDTQLAQALRSTNGRLKVQVASAIPIPGTPSSCQDSNTAPTCNQYLPTSNNLPAGYGQSNPDPDSPNFLAGDVRAGEQPGLTGMHTIWLREHNLMVDYVEEVNSVSYRSNYNANCDATITNAFATAAFRFGHTLIRSKLGLFSLILNGDFSSSVPMNLADRFEDPAFLISTFPKLDEILLGLSSDRAEDHERFITDAVRNRLFADSSTVFGMDLAALNIQRGRDHGLPGWAAYRQHFGLGASVPAIVNSPLFWKDAATASALASKYTNVADIDLFSGMLAEKPKSGALVGDLLYAMLVDQFKRLKDCDRFYYEHGGEQGSFTNVEMKMIKSESLAKVLCRQLPSIKTIQPNVFLQNSQPGNGRVLCSNLLSDSVVFQTLFPNPWIVVQEVKDPLEVENIVEDPRDVKVPVEETREVDPRLAEAPKLL